MSRRNTSFSKQVKNELARVKTENLCCCRAELAAIIHLRGYITIKGKKFSLSIIVNDSSLARYVFSLIKEVVMAAPEILYRENNKHTGSHFIIRITDEAALRKILNYLGAEKKEKWPGMPRVNPVLIKNECCRRCYLRGGFLAGGSINSPNADYNLEINYEHEVYARAYTELLRGFGVTAAVRKRGKGYYVYLKNAEAIMDFLRIIKAYSTVLHMEEQRVLKSIRNQTNRLVNCETANLDKLIKASQRQMRSIDIIDRNLGLNNISSSLAAAAKARRENPEASLQELGEMLNPPVSKPGMSYRMKRLNQIADLIQKQS